MKTIEQMSTKALLSKESGYPEKEFDLEFECVLHTGSDRVHFNIYYSYRDWTHVLVKRFNKGEISVTSFETFDDAVMSAATRCSHIW